MEEGGDPELPVGTIALWSPLNGAVPSGWSECDGTANSPGPDLRDRFIVGRGPTHTVDATGGSLTHTHAGHVVSFPATPKTVDFGAPDGTVTVDAHDSPNHEPTWYALIYIQRMS